MRSTSRCNKAVGFGGPGSPVSELRTAWRYPSRRGQSPETMHADPSPPRLKAAITVASPATVAPPATRAKRAGAAASPIAQSALSTPLDLVQAPSYPDCPLKSLQGSGNAWLSQPGSKGSAAAPLISR
jgi:hypothetical protein